MNRQEKITELLKQAEQTKDIEVLWKIAKELSELKAWSDYSKIIEKMLEIDLNWEDKL